MANTNNNSLEFKLTERIKDYIIKGNNIQLTKEAIDKLSIDQFSFPVRVEPKTRRDDLTESLRCSVYDPLWMLSRQWQMGEFRANNAGTALSVKCKFTQEDCSLDPIEPATESVNPTIDLMAKIESAMYYVNLLRKHGQYSQEKLCSLKEMFPLDWEVHEEMIGYREQCKYKDVAERERALNDRLSQFRNTFKRKAFDGKALYESVKSSNAKVDLLYKEWFKHTYFPCSEGKNGNWNNQELSYTVRVNAGSRTFRGDRYQGGRVSWHTVDRCTAVNKSQKREDTERVTISSLPTIATYQGAPNKRLWQFEDHRVYLGNSEEQQSAANELFMKFATMYSNDWMMIPFDTKVGKYITVENISIQDTFGETKVICNTEKGVDNSVNTFYSNNVYEPNANGTNDIAKGLFYAPQLVNTIEGKPVEQVDLLRDEMANMIWGVESIVSDGCGTTIDQKTRAVRLGEIVDKHNEEMMPTQSGVVEFDVEGTRNLDRSHAAFKYKLQTKVPFNWIPFLPQRMQNDKSGREIALRRGKMPCFLVNENMESDILPVKPVTTILSEGLNGGSYKPMYINEEEVQQTGIKLIKNYQRARWINGKTYNWLGMYKKLANFSENSGLSYDVLKKN